jgi:hypothetical protein
VEDTGTIGNIGIMMIVGITVYKNNGRYKL